jgi:hypothetical protein
MEHHLPQTVALLSRTPRALDALLRDLPDPWTKSNEGDGTWNVVEVVGHLIYADRVDWIPRVQIILETGESAPFAPFDRLGHVTEIQGKSLNDLLDTFAAVRADRLAKLASLSLTAEQLQLPGRHPALGRVTLSELLAAWVAHDLTHLHQIARVLAHQYREATGPFSRFLGVLQCNGHSSNS